MGSSFPAPKPPFDCLSAASPGFRESLGFETSGNGGSSSSGFGCIKMKGSSATRSLQRHNHNNQILEGSGGTSVNLPAQNGPADAQLYFNFILYNYAQVFPLRWIGNSVRTE